MSELKATLGPWEALKLPNSVGPDEWVVEPKGYDTPNDDYEICECYGPDRKANAIAISALPDLYEALVFLRSFHAGHVIANDDLAARLKQADAALSKARGEAQ